jgi:hypothetical protein
LFWATLALQFGNAAILARYFRETEEVDPSVLQSIKRMLDPNRQGLRLKFCYFRRGRPTEKQPRVPSCAAEAAVLLDPPSDRQKWRLKFVRPKGNPGKLNQQARQHAICIKVGATLVAERGKVHRAVEAVAQATKLSRSTVWRALNANKSLTNNSPS